MTQEDIDKINEQHDFVDDLKIFWRYGCCWTSKVWGRLCNLGWYSCRSGAMHYVKDQEGNVACSAVSHAALMVEVSILMR